MRIRIALMLIRAGQLFNVAAAAVAGDYDKLWAAYMKTVPNEGLRTVNDRAERETERRAVNQ